MRTVFQGWLRLMSLAAIGWFGPFPLAHAADAFVWRAGDNQVEAEIEAWPLSRVLESIASATGWQIYVEPDTHYTVTTRFHKLKPADALRRLLGELNFALLPQTNGPARLFIYRNSVHEATQLIQVAKKQRTDSGSNPIPNELIVRLRPGARESIEALAKRLGAKVVGKIDGLNAYRLQFEDAAAAQDARTELEKDKDVASVENNFSIAAPGQVQPLAMSSPPPPSFKLAPPDSSNKLLVALVDTAIQTRGAPWADYIQGSYSLAGVDGSDPNLLKHGTGMMDTIWDALGKTLENPSSASIGFLHFDVYGSGGATTLFDVAGAIAEAVNKGARIINLSLAGYGDSPVLDDVLSQAHDNGILIVASAGNDGSTTPMVPASRPTVLSVTSGTRNGEIAGYANRSDTVDIIAPGASIVVYNGQAYMVTGTSTAAANVSGAAAALTINTKQAPLQAASGITKLPGFTPAKKP